MVAHRVDHLADILPRLSGNEAACWKTFWALSSTTTGSHLYTLKGVLHALCNAHHLRELQALVEIEKEDWARKMQRLLRRACHATNLARERNVALSPGLMALFERCYDTVLTEGFAFHEAQPALISTASKRRGRAPRRVGHNLLLRHQHP